MLGQGISYSMSGVMLNAAFAAAGLDQWRYSLLDITPAEVPAAVAEVRAGRYAGANVTIPHKPQVAALVDELEPDASASGAVNTLYVRGGRLVGANTDVGAIRDIAAAIGAREPRTVAVLGAGGAARAVPVAFPNAVVTLVSRRRPDWHPRWEPWGAAAPVEEADLLVNATPLGRHGELACEHLPRDGAVLDLVYGREDTPLVRMALKQGRAAAGGLPVLAAQGAAAYERWTGREAPLAEMRRALGL